MMHIILKTSFLTHRMKQDISKLIESLKNAGAIKEGDFILTSGKRSRYYVDIKEACTDPAILARVAEAFSELIESDTISGMELGAVPLVVAISILTGKRYIIIRKERKHGTGKLNIGEIKPGETVDIIEDVVTTGGSVLKSANTLREMGAVVKRAICVVDRQEGGSEFLAANGIQLFPIIRISDLRS